MREIDLRAGTPKGRAFRAFKRLAPGLREPQDFRVLRPEADAERIENLRRAGRIYASSRSVVLLSPGVADLLLRSMNVA